jgi:WhiB family redox-sensing transcriptional regulator
LWRRENFPRGIRQASQGRGISAPAGRLSKRASGNEGERPYAPLGKGINRRRFQIQSLDPVEKLDWQEDAACNEYDNVLFFGPDQGESELEKQAREARAKAVCQRCPVLEPCLEFAMETNQKYGIWGGLTDKERASLKRRRARARRAS